MPSSEPFETMIETFSIGAATGAVGSGCVSVMFDLQSQVGFK